jgi:hypothetical protein
MNLSGWVFKDEEDIHHFSIPDSTFLEPGSYLVLCRDIGKFRIVFPNVQPVIGNLGFGLSGGGEWIGLEDDQGQVADSLTYDDVDPWPAVTDGKGPTLSLINPFLDNSKPENWAASLGIGTPGNINDIYSRIDEVPANFSAPSLLTLFQNYPNPFNSSTVIRYGLTYRAEVKITLFNLLGQTLQVLKDGVHSAGEHQLAWNVHDFPSGEARSGVYLCEIVVKSGERALRQVIKLTFLE